MLEWLSSWLQNKCHEMGDWLSTACGDAGPGMYGFVTESVQKWYLAMFSNNVE
jgi:hypothetical protein